MKKPLAAMLNPTPVRPEPSISKFSKMQSVSGDASLAPSAPVRLIAAKYCVPVASTVLRTDLTQPCPMRDTPDFQTTGDFSTLSPVQVMPVPGITIGFVSSAFHAAASSVTPSATMPLKFASTIVRRANVADSTSTVGSSGRHVRV